MTKKERVAMAISHKEPDKVPKGEISIADELNEKLLGSERFKELGSWRSELEVRNMLNMDIAFVNDFPLRIIGKTEEGYDIIQGPFGDQVAVNGESSKIIKPFLDDIENADQFRIPDLDWCVTDKLDYYKKNSDMYVVAQIGGPCSNTYLYIGMEDYMVYSLTNTRELGIIGERIMEYEVNRAKKFIDQGADAILIADDIAFNSGPFLPPKIMDRIVYPYLKEAVSEIKKYRNVPVIFHTDGYIYDELDKIIECGFDGIHSLQPSAGMDIAKVKANYGKDLCLIGNIDLNYVLTFGSVQEVEDEVKRVIDIAAPGGGFILSSCNVLVDMVKPENALAMYNTAEKYGIYKK